jgi:hypothetical protein
MEEFLDTDAVAQICFVTNDLDTSAQWFADLVGKDLPPESKAADPEVAKATYLGKPATVGCRIRMFKFGNIDLEFLEPGPEPSAWRDFLDKHGPGCHHIAFRTRNLTKKHAYLESKGHELLQRGETDGARGRYAYYNTEPQLGVLVELLERNNEMDPQP